MSEDAHENWYREQAARDKTVQRIMNDAEILADATCNDAEARDALWALVILLYNKASLKAENAAWEIYTDRIQYLITKNQTILRREEQLRLNAAMNEDEEHG
jgi:hypothetical protein